MKLSNRHREHDLLECQKSDGKWILVFIFLFLFTLVAFQGAPKQQPKVYTLSMTLEQWQKWINGFGYTAETIRQSDIPSKTANLIIDSLLGPTINQINTQISQQLKAEEAAAKAKVDSTNKKKN